MQLFPSFMAECLSQFLCAGVSWHMQLTPVEAYADISECLSIAEGAGITINLGTLDFGLQKNYSF